MKKVDFSDIDRWAKMAQKPLDNKLLLEDFQQEFFNDFRHWYYRFFYHMVAETKPNVALEIGVHHGHCTIHMAHANKDTVAIGLDKNVARYNIRDNFAKYAPDNAILVDANSLIDGEPAIKRIVEKHGKIGVVFQDSSHYYAESWQEFNIYSKYLDQNSIWCCDDVWEAFGDPKAVPPSTMLDYFNELPGQKKRYTRLHHGGVVGIVLL